MLSTPQGLQQQTSFFMRDKDLGNFSAGSMRQREHLDEATVACWVTFCAAAIRTKVLIVAQQIYAYSLGSILGRNKQWPDPTVLGTKRWPVKDQRRAPLIAHLDILLLGYLRFLEY